MTALYRHFSASGDLLYVGISCKPITRLKQHEHDASWAAQIARVEIEQFADRAAALEAERNAIRAEKPKHNVAHARSAPVWKAEPLKLNRVTMHFGSPVELARFLRSCAVAKHKGELSERDCAFLLRWVKRGFPALWQRTTSHCLQFGILNNGDAETLIRCGTSSPAGTEAGAGSEAS
jgi:predicted GIY-YIG superfamily endonuclease